MIEYLFFFLYTNIGDNMKRKSVILLVSIFIFIAIVGGVSYAFFNYNKSIGNVTLNTGEISINLANINGNLSLLNSVPKSDNEGKVQGNYLDFEVTSTVDSEPIYYEVYILPKSGNTLDTSYIKTYLTDQSNNVIKGVKSYNSLQNSEKENGKLLYKGLIKVNNDYTKKTETKDFRLRLWLDESYTDTNSNTFNFDINLYAYNVGEDFEIPTGANLVRKAINDKINAETNSCNPIWVDDNGTNNDETDDITYFSGTNTCVDMNYVWYSGKLWRITAIYPDGSMKLVTEDVLTVISWGSSAEYDGSWVYQWLNEDFYDTLVNPNDIIISNATWNYSEDGNSTPVRPETITTQKTTDAPIGLLNAYEYYNAYRNATTSTNYLHIGYYWWLITPYSSMSTVRLVSYIGSSGNRSPHSFSYGIRPSIIIKPLVEFSGNGTKSNPFEIVGDKENPTNNVTLLSSRSIGEYVEFDNVLYRIVDTSNGKTKLVMDNVLMNDESAVRKKFASSTYYGKITNTQSDDYWDYYLNNTWYNSISNTYKNMLINETYYLGLYVNTNYKATVCKDSILDDVTIKNCTKYTSSDADKTFTGKVGLLRVGEIFGSNLSERGIWVITASGSSNVRTVSDNYVGNVNPANEENVRPSITLKSGIKITGGTGYVGGETNSPFEISE